MPRYLAITLTVYVTLLAIREIIGIMFDLVSN